MNTKNCNDKMLKSVGAYTPTISNPQDYATYEDALSLYPSMANIVSPEGEFIAEGLYNFTREYVTKNVFNKNRFLRIKNCPVGMLTLYLTMHYFILSLRSVENPLFDVNDFQETSGTIEELKAEQFLVRYSKDNAKNIEQSFYSQTSAGRQYLLNLRQANKLIGISGFGRPWQSL